MKGKSTTSRAHVIVFSTNRLLSSPSRYSVYSVILFSTIKGDGVGRSALRIIESLGMERVDDMG